MDNSRCVILVPSGRAIEPHCDFSLRQLEARGYPVRRLFGFAQIDVARNRMTAEALAEGFDELMWIDSDIAFDPAAVDRLRSHGLPLVSGLYPKKVEREWASRLLPGQASLDLGQGGGLVEILYAAAGFQLVRRPVYEEIGARLGLPLCLGAGAAPVRPFYLPLVVYAGSTHVYLGEDFAFCERARQCGFRILADTTIRLQHIGVYGYSWEDLAGGLTRYPSFRLRLGGREPTA